MKQYVMLVDIDKCNQCYACSLACKDEHFGNDFTPISAPIQELGEHWVNMHIEERGSGSKVRVVCYPEICRHCADPDCAKKSSAVYKREDGIVIIDPEKAKDEHELVDACPHNAIAWNSERKLPQKCTFCAHLLDAGEPVPRCVEACPTGALVFGDINDPVSEVSRLMKEHPGAEQQTGAVRYINMPGRFVAGSVYYNGREEVVSNAKVTLLDEISVITVSETDGFGDFLFKDLPENRDYILRIEASGCAPVELKINTENDVCLEEVYINKI